MSSSANLSLMPNSALGEHSMGGNHMGDVIQQIKGGLIVSCQALMMSRYTAPILMGAMAFAAKEGGAAGIRANGARDVAVIKAMTGLPVIGIDKQIGPDGLDAYYADN